MVANIAIHRFAQIAIVVGTPPAIDNDGQRIFVDNTVKHFLHRRGLRQRAILLISIGQKRHIRRNAAIVEPITIVERRRRNQPPAHLQIRRSRIGNNACAAFIHDHRHKLRIVAFHFINIYVRRSYSDTTRRPHRCDIAGRRHLRRLTAAASRRQHAYAKQTRRCCLLQIGFSHLKHSFDTT